MSRAKLLKTSSKVPKKRIAAGLKMKNRAASLKTKKTQRRQKADLATLINAESALGRTLFGEIPAGHQREFFAARKNVWIWHESWTDQQGQTQEMTIRYEVSPNGVFKRTNRGAYEKIKGAELDNFRLAAKSYLKLIKQQLYH